MAIPIWIIEESPNPGVWNIVQSRGLYKTEARANKAAKELTEWYRDALPVGNPNHGCRFRAVEYQRVR
jgi:hypothetical protein